MSFPSTVCRTFTFCLAQYLHKELEKIEQMPETTLDEVIARILEENRPKR